MLILMSHLLLFYDLNRMYCVFSRRAPALEPEAVRCWHEWGEPTPVLGRLSRHAGPESNRTPLALPSLNVPVLPDGAGGVGLNCRGQPAIWPVFCHYHYPRMGGTLWESVRGCQDWVTDWTRIRRVQCTRPSAGSWALVAGGPSYSPMRISSPRATGTPWRRLVATGARKTSPMTRATTGLVTSDSGSCRAHCWAALVDS